MFHGSTSVNITVPLGIPIIGGMDLFGAWGRMTQHYVYQELDALFWYASALPPPDRSEPTHHRRVDPPYRYFVTRKAPVWRPVCQSTNRSFLMTL